MRWLLHKLLGLLPIRVLLGALLERSDFCGIAIFWLPTGDSGSWTWQVRRIETREDVFGILDMVYEQAAIEIPSRDPRRP